MADLSVYIGWDSREDIAYEVAKESLLEHASIEVDVHPIKLQDLIDRGVYTRAVDPLASTEFTYSRFFTPWLADYKGWALFCDCDFLFFGDVADLLQYRNEDQAVACVHHDYTPKEGVKMDGKIQTTYPRKNWSSFMLFNCGHPSTRNLTPERINAETGAFLHRLQWADDSEIGEIPEEWNWLEGRSSKPSAGYPKGVHYTNGGPWFKNWQDVEYAQKWLDKALAIDPQFAPV